MAFDDVRLPDNLARGFTASPEFQTTIATSGAGYEQRNQGWLTPRHTYQINLDVWDQPRMDALKAFYMARGGKARGFRFRDWTDFMVGQVWSVANGIAGITYGTPAQFATGDGATTAFQLNRVYADDVNPITRKITRPLSGTVKIYKYISSAWVEQTSGVSVNFSTGVVTFTTAPANGVALGWCGQFDVPVRFDTDKPTFSMDLAYVGQVQNIGLIELRE